MIQRPIRLSDRKVYEPASLQVSLTTDSMPTAQMTLRADDEIGMHDILELFTNQGSAGLFRVISRALTYGDQISVSLAGAADTLSDDVYPGTQQIVGTASAVIGQVLAQQTTTRWQLGTCTATSTVKISTGYKDLWSMLEQVRSKLKRFVWTFDYTTTPWTLNLTELPNTLAAEFRIGRNVESASIDISDSEMCTRLYMTVTDPETGQSTFNVYNNATSQARYGIISKTADVSTDDAPDPAAYAAAILEERAEPVAFINIGGEDLHAITGDRFDKITLGSLCRATLPGFGTLTETVTGITWPNVLGEPERITVSLANNLKPFSESLHSMSSSSSGTARQVEKQQDELVRHQTNIDRSDTRLALWATEEQWDEMARQWTVSRKSQFELTSDQIQATVLETGSTAGVKQFDATHAYVYGEKCIYNNVLYRCSNQSGHTGDWSAADFEEVTPMQSQITQTRNQITAEVNRATGVESGLSGRLDVTATQVGLVVEETSGGNVIKAASITAAINENGSQAAINADKILLDGNTTLSGTMEIDNGLLWVKRSMTVGSSGGDTVAINNGKVTGSVDIRSSGYLTFIAHDQSGTPYYQMNGTVVGSMIKTAALDSTTNTLTLTKFNGDVINFSKATTARFSGSWNGAGVYSVTADPNGVTSLTVSPGLRLTGAGYASSFSAEMGSDQQFTSVERSSTGYLHQDGAYVGVYTNYSSGSYTGKIAQVPVSGYVDVSAAEIVSVTSASAAYSAAKKVNVTFTQDIGVKNPGGIDEVWASGRTASKVVDLTSVLDPVYQASISSTAQQIRPASGKIGLLGVNIPAVKLAAKPDTITSNGTYYASSDSLNGFTSVRVAITGHNTLHSNCTDNLTFKAASTAQTSQPTHMYAYVQGRYEDLGNGYWYVRSSYKATQAMYT